MKRITTIILLLCAVLMANALDDRQTKINSIKKSKEYLYSDITMESLEDATSQAFSELQQTIQRWATDRADIEPGSLVSPRDMNNLIDTIMVRRAEMYRVFAYVKKLKLLPIFNDWHLVLLNEFDTDEEHLLSGQYDVTIQDTVPELVEDLEPAPVDTMDLTLDEPEVQELPEPSRERVMPVVQPQRKVVANEKVRAMLKNNFLDRTDRVIEQIKKAKNFFQLRGIMEPLKQNGDIANYGKYATAKNPEECYLIIYDAAGNIRALLDKGETIRMNLKTSKPDSVKNYRGCGAIWFTIKE